MNDAGVVDVLKDINKTLQRILTTLERIDERLTPKKHIITIDGKELMASGESHD